MDLGLKLRNCLPFSLHNTRYVDLPVRSAHVDAGEGDEATEAAGTGALAWTGSEAAVGSSWSLPSALESGTISSDPGETPRPRQFLLPLLTNGPNNQLR